MGFVTYFHWSNRAQATQVPRWNFLREDRTNIIIQPWKSLCTLHTIVVDIREGCKISITKCHTKVTLARCTIEVARVTFPDSDSAPVPKLLNSDPGPEIFQIWEYDSCSDSGYNWGNRKLPMVSLHKWPPRLLLLPNWKVTPDPDPGPKDKRTILPESTPALRIRGPLTIFYCCSNRAKTTLQLQYKLVNTHVRVKYTIVQSNNVRYTRIRTISNLKHCLDFLIHNSLELGPFARTLQSTLCVPW